MGERALTVRDRIIVHLSEFGRYDNEYECPEGMCQSGISAATGKSRAHITLELNRMKNDGLVTERNAHVKGGRSKRKTYLLTPTAQSRLAEINGFLESLNVEIVEQEGSRFLNGIEAAEHIRKSMGIPRIAAVDSVLASGGVLTMSSLAGHGKGPAERKQPPRPENFIPREELDALLSILDREKPNTVMLLGIPGIGKTTLLSELSWSLERGRPVMYRRLYPYDSAASVLTDMGDFLALNGFISLRGMALNPGKLDLAEAGFNLRRALEGRRMVLILDGYEQVPDELRPLFTMLFEQVRGSGCCMIVSSTRKGDFYTMRDKALEGKVSELVMGPLGRDGARAFLGDGVQGRDGILDAAGGHPLTLRLLASGTEPTTLAGFVEDEILGKDSDLAGLCRFASVIRRPFSMDDLELFGFRAAGQVRQNLAFESQPGGGYLLHPAISSILAAATGKRMTRELHSKAADYYRLAGTNARELVHHLMLAGRLDEAREQMLLEWDMLLSAGDPEGLAGIAEKLLTGQGETPAFTVLAAKIFDLAGNRDMAASLAARVMNESPGTLEAAKAVIIHANILAKSGELKKALKALDGMNGAPLGPKLQAEHQYARATVLRRLGRNRDALNACTRAMTAARKADARVMQGQCLMEISVITSSMGEHAKALEALDSVMEIFHDSQSLPDVIRCGINRGMILGSMGREEDGIVALEDAVKRAEEAGLTRIKAHGLANLTDLLNRQGDFSRAEELASVATDIFSGLDEPLMQAVAMFNLSGSMAGLGRRDEAMETMERALALLKDRDLLAGRSAWIEECAGMLGKMGEGKMAEELVKRYSKLCR